jgi:hypothetical protein
MLEQHACHRGVPGGARRVQRGDVQGIARGLVRIGAGIQQQARSVAVAEEGGQASSTIRASAPSAQASKKSGGRLPSSSGASSGWRV